MPVWVVQLPLLRYFPAGLPAVAILVGAAWPSTLVFETFSNTKGFGIPGILAFWTLAAALKRLMDFWPQ